MLAQTKASATRLSTGRLPSCSVPALRASSTRRTPSVVVLATSSQGGKLPIDFSTVVGERLGKWLATPVDLLAFPARAGVGLLLSFPEGVQSVQQDWNRLVELVQDPRPVEEKQVVLRKELEDTVLEFLEKGTNVEQDVLTNLKSILPAEAANALTELIPDPPNKVHQTGPVVPVEEGDIVPAPEALEPTSPHVAEATPLHHDDTTHLA